MESSESSPFSAFDSTALQAPAAPSSKPSWPKMRRAACSCDDHFNAGCSRSTRRETEDPVCDARKPRASHAARKRLFQRPPLVCIDPIEVDP